MALVKYNNNSLSAITAVAGLANGAMTLIKSQTASSSSTVDFVDGTSDVVLDSTYPIYVFKFINVHPANDQVDFQVNFRDGGSSYDATKTTTMFKAYANEGDSDTHLGYDTNRDLAQGTGFQDITEQQDNDNDSSASGTLHLFNPSSTTFVKHFITDSSMVRDGAKLYATKNAGYGNTTSAVDAIRFQMSSGNIDAGDICLYGIA